MNSNIYFSRLPSLNRSVRNGIMVSFLLGFKVFTNLKHVNDLALMSCIETSPSGPVVQSRCVPLHWAGPHINMTDVSKDGQDKWP